MSDIDHLHEARQHVAVTPTLVEHHLQRAQGHALISIAEELRRFNDRKGEAPLYTINVSNPPSEYREVWQGIDPRTGRV